MSSVSTSIQKVSNFFRRSMKSKSRNNIKIAIDHIIFWSRVNRVIDFGVIIFADMFCFFRKIEEVSTEKKFTLDCDVELRGLVKKVVQVKKRFCGIFDSLT